MVGWRLLGVLRRGREPNHTLAERAVRDDGAFSAPFRVLVILSMITAIVAYNPDVNQEMRRFGRFLRRVARDISGGFSASATRGPATFPQTVVWTILLLTKCLAFAVGSIYVAMVALFLLAFCDLPHLLWANTVARLRGRPTEDDEDEEVEGEEREWDSDVSSLDLNDEVCVLTGLHAKRANRGQDDE